MIFDRAASQAFEQTHKAESAIFLKLKVLSISEGSGCFFPDYFDSLFFLNWTHTEISSKSCHPFERTCLEIKVSVHSMPKYKFKLVEPKRLLYIFPYSE